MKIFKIIKTMFLNLIIILLLFILALVMYSFVQLNIQEKEYADVFGYSIFQIETGSMSDTLEIEDIIIIKLGNDQLKEGDIVTFKRDKDFITHRIIKINEDKIITKGDNNNSNDEPIKQEDIIGEVEIIISNVRIWKAVFKDIKVIISLIITFILFVLMVAYKEKIGENDV